MWTFHSKENSDGVRVTVVGAVKDGTLTLSAARCSANDQYNKKVGRKIAIGRHGKGKIVSTVTVDENCDGRLFTIYASNLAIDVANKPELVTY